MYLDYDDKKTFDCSICGNNYPTELIWCSHIKKRKYCTKKERLDLENIVIPMCKFGCDDLFEKGYIYVQKQIIKNNTSKKTTKDLRNFLYDLIGRTIPDLYYNEERIKYYEYHKEKAINT